MRNHAPQGVVNSKVSGYQWINGIMYRIKIASLVIDYLLANPADMIILVSISLGLLFLFSLKKGNDYIYLRIYKRT